MNTTLKVPVPPSCTEWVRHTLCRVVLDCPSEDMMPGGCKRHLLDRLRQCRILSDDERWDVCAVTPAPSRGYLAEDLLAGVPFQARTSKN